MLFKATAGVGEAHLHLAYKPCVIGAMPSHMPMRSLWHKVYKFSEDFSEDLDVSQKRHLQLYIHYGEAIKVHNVDSKVSPL